MHRVVVLVTLLASLLGCAGLGVNPQPATRDICNLLTVAEIEQYYGWPDTTPDGEQGDRGPTCGYREPSNGSSVIRLSLSPVAAIPCDQLKDAPNSQQIAGIGEWAYYSNDRQVLYAKKGGDCLEVTAGEPPGAEGLVYLTSLTELARLAVGRL